METVTYRKHETALVETSSIGEGSSIGAYSIVRGQVRLGRGCVIQDHVVLDGALEIADRVVIESHSCLRGPATIGADVRVGPQVSLTSSNALMVTVKNAVVIGPHATVTGPLVIAEAAVIEPGSVVTKNVPANAVVAGNPARIVRYHQTPTAPAILRDAAPAGSITRTTVRGVTLHELPMIEDLRGNLSFGEMERHVPFPIKRYFLTFDVDSEEARGEHAHRALEQFLLCVHGRVHIVADDGRNREEFVLDRPTLALYLPPLVWGVQYRFSPGAVLLVLCSDFYDPADYIRDYAEFLSVVK